MQTLPQILRDYLVQQKYTQVTKNLMFKYQLRVDQGGVLEQEIILLLMGIDSPDEFAQSLATEARLDKAVIAGIMADVNTQIFIPLRQEMEHGEAKTETPKPQPAAPVREGAPSYIPEYPAGTYAPPPQSPRYPNQEPDNVNSYLRRTDQAPHHMVNKIPPPPIKFRPVAPSAPANKPPETSSGAKPVAQVSQPLSSDRLLEDHEEAHIEFNKPTVRLVTPKLPQRPAPSSPDWVPPNLPGVVRMPPVLEVKPSLIVPKAAMPKPPSPAPSQPPAPPRPYSVDPYREPLDEHTP